MIRRSSAGGDEMIEFCFLKTIYRPRFRFSRRWKFIVVFVFFVPARIECVFLMSQV